jgi:putative ABC transport system ATP-binding protein
MSETATTAANVPFPPVGAEGPAPALELRNVSKAYQQGSNRVVVLEGVDLAVRQSEFVALIGPSGSGKSTLLHLAGGLDRPDAGTVLVTGTDVGSLGAKRRAQLRRRQIGFVFQFFQLLPTLSVLENVELPLVFEGQRRSGPRALGLLERMGMGTMTNRYPSELSGGEMQRVAIARALVAGAPLILADEPTGNLDSVNGAEVLALLTEEVREAGAALLLVTHDRAASERADRVLTLVDGRLT